MTLEEKIIAELEKSRELALSISGLSAKFGASQECVHSALKSISNMGYIFSGSYDAFSLAPGCDIMSAAGIRAWLPERYRSIGVVFHSVIDSTNTEAKRIEYDPSVPMLIAAEHQTAGRGRQGKSFYSPADTGIYMSLLLSPEGQASDSVSVTTAAAVGTARAIRALTGASAEIKWVNDIYIGGKKVCGILTEAVTDPRSAKISRLIIGIGVNVTTEAFPSELESIAASIGSTGIPRVRIAAEIAAQVLDIITAGNSSDYIEDYRRWSMVIGKDITYYRSGTAQSAHAVGIDNDGGLIVEHPDGSTHTLRTGEITVRLS